MRDLKNFLNSDSLKSLVNKANSLSQINLIWHQAIADHRAYSKVANFEAGELVIEINNSSNASLFRFDLPEIRKKLRQFKEFSPLTRIRIQVVYPGRERVKVIGEAAKLSSLACQVLEQAVKHIENPALKQSLARLASRYKKDCDQVPG